VLKFSLENFLIEHEIKSDEPSKWRDAYLGSFVTPILGVLGKNVIQM
jgi:hypothetical protein